MKTFSYGIMAEKGISLMGQIEFWFDTNKRDLPWRLNRTPYRVWISEVMLQQTRASVVIPYFLRWMEFFPNVKALYMAPIEQVIKAWEGLGYYSRARNLHKAAQQIVEQFGGEIPNTRETLLSIQGFGPYTTNAVLSFGFHQRAVAVDGNVLRVLSRFFSIEENIDKMTVRRKIEEKGETLLDLEKPWVTAEALIELGATICLPKPRCEDCPLRSECRAFRLGKAENLPVKNEAKSTVVLQRIVFVIEYKGAVLVKKGEKGKIMADLYEFPYRNWEKKSIHDQAKIFYKEELKWVKKLKEKQHSFTRYKARLFPVWFKSKIQNSIPGYEWVAISRLSELPFSSGHRKIVEELML